jgi:L-lactate utilization protein LutC
MNEWLDDQRQIKHQQTMETNLQEYEKKFHDFQDKVEQKCRETTETTRKECEELLKKTHVDGIAIAKVLHYNEYKIKDIKKKL